METVLPGHRLKGVINGVPPIEAQAGRPAMAIVCNAAGAIHATLLEMKIDITVIAPVWHHLPTPKSNVIGVPLEDKVGVNVPVVAVGSVW